MLLGFNDDHMVWVMQAILAGRVGGMIAAPPAGTWSSLRARTSRRLAAAAPLRTRASPFECREGASWRERARVGAENRALWCCMHLAMLGASRATWMTLCHPADRGSPHPSFFACPEFEWFKRQVKGEVADLDLCMYGSDTRRRTTVCSTDLNFINSLRIHVEHRCAHRSGHVRPAAVWGRALATTFALPPAALALQVNFLARRIRHAGAACQ